MPEKSLHEVLSQFLSNYGPKIRGAEEYNPDDDQCDQRAPVNDPEALYNSFIVPEEVMNELDDEEVDDFDNDIYDYEDRTDLGVDIAQAAELDLQRKRFKRTPQHEQEPKDEPDSEPAE